MLLEVCFRFTKYIHGTFDLGVVLQFIYVGFAWMRHQYTAVNPMMVIAHKKEVIHTSSY